MATQRITIAKIGGDAGMAVISQFREWSDARTIDDPTEWRPDQWPLSHRREMDAFAIALRANDHKPPVIFFSEYIDLWSMGDLFTRWFPGNDDHSLIQLHSDRYELWCYPLPDDGMLADHLRSLTSHKRFRDRDSQEDRWFTLNLLEATLAWHAIVNAGAIVLLREVVGGLVEDSEIEESLTDIPEWITKISANAR